VANDVLLQAEALAVCQKKEADGVHCARFHVVRDAAPVPTEALQALEE